MVEAGWGKAPLLLRIVIIACLVSFVTLIIGYSTPLWFSYSGGIPVNLYGLSGISGTVFVDHLGLWHACGGGHGCIAITYKIPVVTMEPGWKNSPSIIKAIAVFNVLSFSFFVIGYAAPFWGAGDIRIIRFSFTRVDTIHLDVVGLWHACGWHDGCVPISLDIAAYLGATRAFESMGLIAMAVTLVCIVLFVWIPSCAGNARIELAIMISSFVSSGLIIIGVIIFGAEFKYYLNFSYALCCISGILNAMTGGMVILFKCNR